MVCDKATALTTAQTITAALYARERGAGGQHLEISMLACSIAFLWPDGLQNHTFLTDEAAGAPGDEAASVMSDLRTPEQWITISEERKKHHDHSKAKT